MKLISKVFITVLTTFLLSGLVINQVVDYSAEYNQKMTFPNQFEAATNSTQLDKANYTTPFMSHILFETDPKRKIRKHEFLELLRFQAFRLTKGEAERIFEFADGSRDDLLDSEEWENFNGLYVFPFEACDRNHDYLLDSTEFADCFDKDPRSRFIVFRRKNDKNKFEEMIWTISSRSAALLNFHDYLFIRRALFAWKNCQSNSKYISKNAFKCATRSAILGKVHFTGDLDHIYDTGIKNANDLHVIELDFINYLRTLYSLYVFSSFGEPISTPYIEKVNFIKAIKEDRLPTNFEEKEVEYFYELINTNPMVPVTQMNYATFHFFWNYHKLFNKYSATRPLLLTKDEFLKLCDDEWFSQSFKYTLDRAKTKFSQKDYLEASLVLQRKRPNEAKYFFSFKQDASENSAGLWNATSVNATYFLNDKNMTNREVFFSTFTEINKLVWTKEQYYKALQLGNLFDSLVSDWRHLVASTHFVDKLMDQYVLVNPPINFKQRVNYPMYKFLPREIYVDVLVFAAIENYRHKFKAYLNSSNTYIYESYAKLMLMDFGMENMPDTILDLGKKGFDNLRRRTYDANEMMKNCLIVQAVAGENSRSKDWFNVYHLHENVDPSRKYPDYPRKAMASPWV